MSRKPKTSRPRITPQIEKDIIRRLDAGRTPAQIHQALTGSGDAGDGASLATIYRIKELHDVEQATERRVRVRVKLEKLKALMLKHTNMNGTEIDTFLADLSDIKS